VKTVVFAYQNIGIIGIQRLLDAGFGIELVFSHDDDPGAAIWFGSVKDLCRDLDIPCVCPRNPNQFGWSEKIRACGADFIFCFGYQGVIRPSLLALAKMGAFNLHYSLLPHYRGKSPVNWVLAKGEAVTGVTLQVLDEKPQAGAIIRQEQVEISREDTALSLHRRLDSAADTMLAAFLPHMKGAAVRKNPMDLSRGSYFEEMTPEDGRIFWDRPADEIYNLIRAVTRPFSGAYGFVGDEMVTFWWGLPDNGVIMESGRIKTTTHGVLVGTGYGCINIMEIEVNGRTLKGEGLRGYFKDHDGESAQ